MDLPPPAAGVAMPSLVALLPPFSRGRPSRATCRLPPKRSIASLWAEWRHGACGCAGGTSPPGCRKAYRRHGRGDLTAHGGVSGGLRVQEGLRVLGDLAGRRMLDLSVSLYDNCPGIPEVEPPHLRMLSNAARDGWNLERLDMPLHWGTHMDAPYHLGLPRTMDSYLPEDLHGPAVAVDCFEGGAGLVVGAAELASFEADLRPGAVVLLCAGWWRRRGWSSDWVDGAPRLGLDGAQFLATCGVRGCGVEGFSVGGRSQENMAVHRALLGNGIWVAEGLRLDRELLSPARWHVLALPLLVERSSGAPARVIAVEAPAAG